MFNLTPRETQIINLIIAGKTNKQIAEELVIAHQTVKHHCSSIYKKLRVKNRTQAAVKVWRMKNE